VINAQNGQAYTSGFGTFVNTQDVSSGYEAKVDYLPLRNLRIHLGFTKADFRITGVDPFVAPANPNPTYLAAQQAFIAAAAALNPSSARILKRWRNTPGRATSATT